MGTIDAIAFGAEHEIVPRRTPRCLLHNIDIRHAVFGEYALILGDEQRTGIAERDEAELGDLHLRASTLRECATGKIQTRCREKRSGAGASL